MENLITAIEGSAISHWVINSIWAWPVMEMLHFVGLSLLLGSLLIIDLRLAGFFRQINIAATHKLLPWTFLGFAINLVTGFLFVMGDPGRYFVNIGFRWKMALVMISGLNALWFWFKLNSEISKWAPHGDTPGIAKVIALVSLCSWFGVMLLGRLIPYIGTG